MPGCYLSRERRTGKTRERRRGATDKPAEGQLVSNLRYTAQSLFDEEREAFLKRFSPKRKGRGQLTLTNLDCFAQQDTRLRNPRVSAS